MHRPACVDLYFHCLTVLSSVLPSYFICRNLLSICSALVPRVSSFLNRCSASAGPAGGGSASAAAGSGEAEAAGRQAEERSEAAELVVAIIQSRRVAATKLVSIRIQVG